MSKRRHYVCETGYTKRDALAEAAIIRKHIGHKATVKSAGGGLYKVCRTMKRPKRR